MELVTTWQGCRRVCVHLAVRRLQDLGIVTQRLEADDTRLRREDALRLGCRRQDGCHKSLAIHHVLSSPHALAPETLCLAKALVQLSDCLPTLSRGASCEAEIDRSE